MPRTVYPFSYYLPRKDSNRPLKAPQTRDDAASREVLAALLERGFRYGEPLLNYPPAEAPGRLLDEHELHRVDVSFLRPGDVLLTLTRPPIHDIEHGDRKQIEPGNTDLERRVFEAWRRALEVCARSHVKLSPALQRQLRAGFESRRDMAFKQSGGGFYKELNALDTRGWKRPPGEGLTAAFLLWVDELPGGPPGLINAFGMDAVSTLVWAYRLRRDFSYLLERPGFAMVEIQTASIPERPTNLRWALDWKIEPLLVESV